MNSKIKKQILESLDLLKFKKTQQEKILSAVLKNVSARITLEAWKKLSEAQKNELKKFSKSSKKTLDYLNSEIKDFPKLVENVTRKTVDEFMTLRTRQ